MKKKSCLIRKLLLEALFSLCGKTLLLFGFLISSARRLNQKFFFKKKCASLFSVFRTVSIVGLFRRPVCFQQTMPRETSFYHAKKTFGTGRGALSIQQERVEDKLLFFLGGEDDLYDKRTRKDRKSPNLSK